MEDIKTHIIYQDDHYLAINKPSGLLVHPSLIDKHEKRTAVNLLQEALQTKVYVIHRLDKPTSGVMLFALDQDAARKGIEAFARSDVKKAYLAVVRGYTDETGSIRRSLPPVPDKLLDAKKNGEKKSKTAVTLFRALGRYELPVFISRHPKSRYSLLEIHPQTGRMHQIRRHLKQIKHPIIGDTKHGDHNHNRYFREQLGCHRLLLSATELTFFHPFEKRHIRLTASIDTTFAELIERFGWLKALPQEWLNPVNSQPPVSG